MGEIVASTTVFARNGIGQFARECELAAGQTIKETVERGAKLSKALAPSGHKADPRTIPLKASIKAEVLSRTSGRWVATARHALPIELGAGAHEISGDVEFFWEKAGRMWIPFSAGLPWLHPIIHHPGNSPQPYLRPAYEQIMAEVMAIARRYYPN